MNDYQYDKYSEEIYNVEVELRKLEAEYEHLKNMKETYLARLCNNYNGSEAAKRRGALGSVEFEEYLIGIKEAQVAYGNLKAKWYRTLRQHEDYRSMQSTEREKLRQGI